MIKNLLQYRKINNSVLRAISAQLSLQIINTAFLMALVQYMKDYGYEDFQAAEFISKRFLGVLLVSFPLGLIIKGRKLKPFFLIAVYCVPPLALLILYGIENHIDWLIETASFIWGITFVCLQVSILPYILRNAGKEYQSEAITLNYTTFSISTFLGGIAIVLLKDIFLFEYNTILKGICCVSFIGIPLVHSIKSEENVPCHESKRSDLSTFDWNLIIKAVFPTIIIAVGAGLTIPFMGAFFDNIYNLDINRFALIVIFTSLLVSVAALSVPFLKRRFGYKIAITLSQTFAVLALAVLGSTELFSEYSFALTIAIVCYVMRQPLMNMAQPMTTELVMSYVGEKNQEMISSLTAAIWSGSWFFSAWIFQLLREANIRYAYIFLTTAILYSIGVMLYYLLIVEYEKKSVQ